MEPKYRAETCQSPLGETGDYDSWIELVTPDFNLQCYDPDVDLGQVQELADALNKIGELDENKIREAFRNTSDCYADTWKSDKGFIEEGEVIQAITETGFVKLINNLLKK